MQVEFEASRWAGLGCSVDTLGGGSFGAAKLAAGRST